MSPLITILKTDRAYIYGLRLQNAKHAIVFILGIHVGIFKGVILHMYHVLCAWVYVIEIQTAVSYIYTCHVQVSTALSRINYFTKILFDMEARIVIRNTSISFKHISCGVLLYIIVY